MTSNQLTMLIGYALVAILLVLWRLDVRAWNRERSSLLDRIQAGAGGLQALDDHREREIWQETLVRDASNMTAPVDYEEPEKEQADPLAEPMPDSVEAQTAVRELMG